jgi:hypothetical protein
MTVKTNAQLTTDATTIRDETTAGANTALRVGTMLIDMIDSKVNVDYTDTLTDVWSPGLVGRTTPGTQTYSTNTGTYRKRGKLVFVRAEIVLTANSGGSGDALITLPFTAVSGTMQALTIAYVGDITISSGYDFLSLGIDAGSTRLLIFENKSASARQNLPIGNVAATGKICFSGTYEASA